MRALVVENDDIVATLSQRLLEQEGFRVETAATVAEGSQLARANDYAVIILDLLLADGDGMDVLKIIRERADATPVLVLSGADDVDSTVRALDAGADDYLHKPYKSDELRARVRALMRRGQLVGSPHLECGNVLLHRVERRATVAEGELKLTAKEFALLEYFIVNRGTTITRKQLLEKVWHVDFDPGTNMIDVNVARLRAKLIALGATCRLDTERGVGYVLSD